MQLQLEKMQSSDVPEVAQIEKLCFSQPWSENGFRTALEYDYNCYLVARKSVQTADENLTGGIAGYCGLQQSFEDAEILNVAVRPDQRGQGIAFSMLQRLMEIGRERGVERFTLEVRKSNAAALHLYEKLGFVSAGIRRNFYEKPVEDAVIMWTESDSTI
ncbi:MAG: ribosomal protein S18-alanine N-acetyltransferase [Lachnospiraceae bacterium]|nr:ribosomal protein S18-alanine N-acetyltransferase [Lachnospiraceae bacterium]